jgi:hypothetical protein
MANALSEHPRRLPPRYQVVGSRRPTAATNGSIRRFVSTFHAVDLVFPVVVAAAITCLAVFWAPGNATDRTHRVPTAPDRSTTLVLHLPAPTVSRTAIQLVADASVIVRSSTD